jgi:S1-C subfamily serine protease
MPTNSFERNYSISAFRRPLINTEGRLGLNTSGLTRGSSLTIPVKVAWRVADSLAKHGSVKRGYLGVRTQPVEIPEAAGKLLKREQEHGLLISWLEEGGPAQTGGLFVGDIIVAVSGQLWATLMISLQHLAVMWSINPSRKSADAPKSM